MKVYISCYSTGSKFLGDIVKKYHPYILESFISMSDDIAKMIPEFGSFMLDSGAYTFLQRQKKKHQQVNWDQYLESYAQFIIGHNIKYFFELDIDNIIGYEKVLEYRKTLERLTGKQCIPVWHKTRGIEEFKRSCHEYPYVAVGGNAIKELTSNELKYFPALISYAHSCGAKIHGLGFTKLTLLPKYHFDSVDGAYWIYGNIGGYFYKFKNGRIIVETQRRVRANSKSYARHNFIEFIKYQKYADINLEAKASKTEAER